MFSVLFFRKDCPGCRYLLESVTTEITLRWFNLKWVLLNRHLPFPWSRRQIVSGRLQFPLDSWPTPWTCHSCPCTKPWTSPVTSRLCVVHTLPEAIPTERRRSRRWCVYQRRLVRRILLLQQSLCTLSGEAVMLTSYLQLRHRSPTREERGMVSKSENEIEFSDKTEI